MIKLNKNKISLNQCNKIIEEINRIANIKNIKVKFSIHKSIIENDKYKLLLHSLKEGSNKLPILKGTYELNELQNELFKYLTK